MKRLRFKENDGAFKLFQTIKLATDNYCGFGVPRNSLGVILEIYGNDDYEVEFCNEKGETLLLQSFNRKELDVI